VNRRQALARARTILADGNIEDASLEGEVLLRHVLGIDRAGLFTDIDSDLSPDQEKSFIQLVERRRRGKPAAYITGHKEFYGLDFLVNRAVLIPRPETELLVDKAIELAKSGGIADIADVGTGCGAIAVGLAANLPRVIIHAIDISPAALEVARANCKNHGVADRVLLLRGDLLEPLAKPVDMIVANLPYVREADLYNNMVLKHEPLLALDGGKEGLDGIKALCMQVEKKLRKKGCLLLEIGEGQAEAVTSILRGLFSEAAIEVHRDLAGIERVVGMRLTSRRSEC
jgi:release factor glutamine methyltransferase